MSPPKEAGMRPAWLALAAGLIAIFAWALSAQQAQAAFTTGKCAGPNITGQGASFARDAHEIFNGSFSGIFCAGTAGAGQINVAYNPTGSGSGRTAVTSRTLEPRFGMSDDPLTSAQTQTINTGGDAIATNDGVINQIPAAVGAVAPLVNFPNGCDVSLLPAGSRTAEQDRTTDGIPDGVVRVIFTKVQFEGIMAADAGFSQWDEVFPSLAGDADCDKDIIRVVRLDASGTTFALKDYLNRIDGAEGWLTTYQAGANGNREWPVPSGSAFGTGGQCGTTAAPGPQADTVDRLTSGCSNGNEFLVDTLKVTDGSIGYSDVSTARKAGLEITPRTTAGSPFDNDTYWTQVPNGSGTSTDPGVGEFGFRSDGQKGSNCSQATFSNVPTTTQGDWSQASAVNSPAGYGICTATYGLVFDDNATVWGSSAAEEAKARTVKDYWESIVSENSQALLATNDYARLPASLLTISRAGVAGIGWNKAGDSDAPPTTTPPTMTPPTTTPPTVTPPSNSYSVERTKIDSKNGSVTVQVRVPGPGTVEMIATADKPKNKKNDRAGTIDVGRVVLTANAAGSFPLTLKPSNAAKKVLKKEGKLKVDLALKFTPTGGTAAERSTSATLKIKKKKKKD